MPNFAVDVRETLKDRPKRVYLVGASPRAVMEDALRQGLIVESVHPCDGSEFKAPEPPTQPKPVEKPAPVRVPAAPAVVKFDASPTVYAVARVLAWIFIVLVGFPLVVMVIAKALGH